MQRLLLVLPLALRRTNICTRASKSRAPRATRAGAGRKKCTLARSLWPSGRKGCLLICREGAANREQYPRLVSSLWRLLVENILVFVASLWIAGPLLPAIAYRGTGRVCTQWDPTNIKKSEENKKMLPITAATFRRNPTPSSLPTPTH